LDRLETCMIKKSRNSNTEGKDFGLKKH
jgi:hypothetical protein